MTAIGAIALSQRHHNEDAAAPGLEAGAKVVRKRQDLDALAGCWQALEAGSGGATLFQSLGWVRAVFDFEAARQNPDFDPVIAVLREGQQVVAVLPLERVRTAMRRVLVPLGNGFGQYCNMLLAPGIDPGWAVARLLEAAIAAAPCDAVSLLKVRDGSSLFHGLPGTAIETGAEAGAPYVALEDFADFAGYFATIRTKTRKNMRNARNRLERSGPVEHRVATDPAEQLGLIERTLAGRAERLRDQGLTSRAFRDSGFPDFCRQLVGHPDIELMTFSLTQKGKPIAEQWGFVHGGRYYAYVAARDFSNSDESPGKLHMGEVLKACSERGLSGCDLGVPVMPYKLTFATKTVIVRDFALPVTLKGWLIIQGWDVLLRPALKGAILRMPAGLRTRLMRLAWRRA